MFYWKSEVAVSGNKGDWQQWACLGSLSQDKEGSPPPCLMHSLIEALRYLDLPR